MFARTLVILEARLFPGHPVPAAVRGNYADLLVQLGRGEEASALRTRAEAIRRQCGRRWVGPLRDHRPLVCCYLARVLAAPVRRRGSALLCHIDKK